ncbi:MAG: hypothetical protein ACYTF6_06765 [Planctomycetota bacterium]|jgi:hypothetical protein
MAVFGIKRRRTARWPIRAAIALCLLTGTCIPVEDFGEYWEKGTIDAELEGHWKKMGMEFRSQDEYVSFVKDGSHYRWISTRADAPDRPTGRELAAKTLPVGKHRFLMVCDAAELKRPTSRPAAETPAESEIRLGGGLIRYTVEGDRLITYALNADVLVEAIKKGDITGRAPGDDDHEIRIPKIPKLDEKTVDFLGKLADDPENWKVTGKFQRIEDLEKALAASRTYPATEQTPANTLVEVNLPDLKYFAEDRQELLLRHLQASPEWKVFDSGGRTVCYRRLRKSGKWLVTMNGYHSSVLERVPAEQRWQIRYLFRFSEKPERLPARRRYLTEAGPLAGKVHLKLKSSDQGIESYLAVGQEGLWFEFFEQTLSEPRTRTREALKWLEEFLAELRKAEEEIRESGYAAAVMPEGGVSKGQAGMEVADSIQPGIYDVSAWVNPGAEGEVFLKVFDAGTGQRLSEDRITGRSKERIGWSKDPGVLFLYNANITVYEGDWDHSYDARFELWFKDAETGKEKKLIDKTRTIHGWER